MCLNTGTPKNHHFPFVTNGKVVVLGVPILKNFRVMRKGQREIWCAKSKEIASLIKMRSILTVPLYIYKQLLVHNLSQIVR